MKPQTRPFVIETKTKRRPAQANTPSWSTIIDEPSPDDLPSREIRDGSVAFDTPFAAANRVFSAFATSAISTASTLGDLAGTVFRPATAQRSESESASLAVADERGTGRILPSLSSPNPFDSQLEGEARSAPVKPKQRRQRTPKITDSLIGPDEAMEPSRELVTEQANTKGLAAEPQADLNGVSLPRGRKRNRDPSGDRVRAGEGWKRRRLRKALW
jgi:hypothetical protein